MASIQFPPRVLCDSFISLEFIVRQAASLRVGPYATRYARSHRLRITTKKGGHEQTERQIKERDDLSQMNEQNEQREKINKWNKN
jgi:hypothetical protein